MRDLSGTEYNINDFMAHADGKKIVIFGAGKYGNYIYGILQENNIPIYAICDNNKEKLCSMKETYPVRTLDDLESTRDEYYFIIAIAKLEILKVIRNQLYAYGIKPDKMVIPLPEINSGWFDSLIMFDSEFCIQAVKEQWWHARLCSTQIVEYFESNDLCELIVFENAELRGWLDQDLRGSGVMIKKRISSLEEFGDQEECDAVVVLDEANYEIIEEELMRRTEAPIISIWDVVRF